MTDKNRQELVEEFLKKKNEHIYATDKHPAIPIETLAQAVRATATRFRDCGIKMDFTCGLGGPNNGVAKIFLDNTRDYELERLMYKSNANEDVRFHQILSDAKSHYASICSFFFGYIQAIDDAAKAVKRELEIRSELEYNRSNRYL